jgi:hypothetical protein
VLAAAGADLRGGTHRAEHGADDGADPPLHRPHEHRAEVWLKDDGDREHHPVIRRSRPLAVDRAVSKLS